MQLEGSLIVLESDPHFAALITRHAEARGWRAAAVTSVVNALELLDRGLTDVVLANVAFGPEGPAALLARLRLRQPDVEVVLMAECTSTEALREAFEANPFAVVARSEMHQMFWALSRALERRHLALQNRRPAGELQTLNDLAAEIAQAPGAEQMLQRTLTLVARPMPSWRPRDSQPGDLHDRASGDRQPFLRAIPTPSCERPADLVDACESPQIQLLQSEKLSAIGQLVAGIAHELNNPLTSVIGYAQLLEEEMTQGSVQRPRSEVARDLRRIAEESGRAARIVRGLLTFARRQTTARAPQDLAEVCRRVVALRQHAFRTADVDLRTVWAPGVFPVFADGGQLEQAVLNLVLNAEQAMRQSDERRLTISVRKAADDALVELCVSDTGHGIEPGDLSRIFDPFFTTREVGDGTGLGLSVCYGIVRGHGGEIAVDSRPGVGTRFLIRLPVWSDAFTGDGSAALVAHPDENAREFLAAALRGWGHEPVVVAADAQEALELRRSRVLRLVVVDDAFVARAPANWWRAGRQPAVPTVVTSFSGGSPAADSSGRCLAAAVLNGPLSLQAISGAVQRAISRKEYV